VDTGSESLKAALTARPTGIKVNSREASEVTGLVISDISSALKAAGHIRKMGIGKVILTMGKNGAILSCEEGEWSSRPPLIKRISTVGSGDAFLAGFLHGQTVGIPYPEMLRMATAAGAANALETGGGCFKLQDYYDLLNPVIIQRI